MDHFVLVEVYYAFENNLEDRGYLHLIERSLHDADEVDGAASE